MLFESHCIADIMWVALPEGCSSQADELGIMSYFSKRSAAAVAHPGADTPQQLCDYFVCLPTVWHESSDGLRDILGECRVVFASRVPRFIEAQLMSFPCEVCTFFRFA